MKTIEAYKSYDGKIFENYDKALDHEFDIIGETFDGLIKRSQNQSEIDRWRQILESMKSPDFLDQCIKLGDIAQFLKGSGIDQDTITREVSKAQNMFKTSK